MKIFNKYNALIGKKFGKLIYTKIEQVRASNGNNRMSCLLHFSCDCGTIKVYSAHNASKIFEGSTISCGCARKEKWRKSYYTWKKFQESNQLQHGVQ